MVHITFTYPIKEMHNYYVYDCEIDSFHFNISEIKVYFTHWHLAGHDG